MISIAWVLAAFALLAGPAIAEEHFNAINPATLADGLSVGDSPPAGTVLGVEKLAFDELLIEIEVIAAVK